MFKLCSFIAAKTEGLLDRDARGEVAQLVGAGAATILLQVSCVSLLQSHRRAQVLGTAQAPTI
ncbi:MAG: hypothetical protein CYG59_10865 [Chloroflexi bacterium]|nr:MAG: hypothetical protein CYG59_10865 [Chloroflexota bacterium]